MSEHPVITSQKAITRFLSDFNREAIYYGAFIEDMTLSGAAFKNNMLMRVNSFCRDNKPNYSRGYNLVPITRKIEKAIEVWMCRKKKKGDILIFNVPSWFCGVLEVKMAKMLINQIRPIQCLPLLLMTYEQGELKYYFISMRTIIEYGESHPGAAQHTENWWECVQVRKTMIDKQEVKHLVELPQLVEQDCRDNYEWCRLKLQPYITKSKDNKQLMDDKLYEKVTDYGITIREFEQVLQSIRGGANMIDT